jgi:hypothetical protein
MRSLLLSLMIIGLLFVSAAPANANDGAQLQRATITHAYLPNATDQGIVTPVARFYYGAPGWRGWYGYNYYPRYRAYYSPYYYSYPYQTYAYPGSTYGYGYYPYNYYYSARRPRLGYVY